MAWINQYAPCKPLKFIEMQDVRISSRKGILSDKANSSRYAINDVILSAATNVSEIEDREISLKKGIKEIQCISLYLSNPDSMKIDTLPNGVKYYRFCGDCGSKTTSGHWCSDIYVEKGYICQKCYR